MVHSRRSSEPAIEQNDDVMKKKYKRKLLKQMRKIKDPRRYFVASIIHGSWVFYYDVKFHAFAMNKLEEATAFKSKKIARAVKRALGKRYKIVVAIKKKNGKYEVVPNKKESKKPNCNKGV